MFFVLRINWFIEAQRRCFDMKSGRYREFLVAGYIVHGTNSSQYKYFTFDT